MLNRRIHSKMKVNYDQTCNISNDIFSNQMKCDLCFQLLDHSQVTTQTLSKPTTDWSYFSFRNQIEHQRIYTQRENWKDSNDYYHLKIVTTIVWIYSFLGEPGVDYPIYSIIPKTEFNCSEQRYKGFFGDPETGCQVWHYCDLNGGQASFLCPNGTIFSQVSIITSREFCVITLIHVETLHSKRCCWHATGGSM